MADLVVDSAMLHDLHRRLAFVVSMLEQAEPLARYTAGACASGGLAEAVVDFAEDWEDHREDILNDVRTISNMVSTVDDGFSKMDAALRDVLLNAVKG